MKINITVFLLFVTHNLIGQLSLKGKVSSANDRQPLPGATVFLPALKKGVTTDGEGLFSLGGLGPGEYTLKISSVAMKTVIQKVSLPADSVIQIMLEQETLEMKEVVVTGTMKEMSKLDSPVPVDIITPKFLMKNPVPSIFDALQNVNGVRPQLNCNICSTGDIHINGLEGPYTMVLIDGMPIVSSLATVYGLSGIPNSLIERVEVVKGPASSLYGSEAVGGLVNIITKNPDKAPAVSADVFTTSWRELNADIGVRFKTKGANALAGVSYFGYDHPIDKNGDGFTDLTLQKRVSLFNKWNFKRASGRLSSVAARWFYEDRWGGQMNWTPADRGKDEVYGESIYTKRFELTGTYQLPVKDRLLFQYSYNYHDQDSYYGLVAYMARQQVAFGQFTYDKMAGRHSLLAGMPFRYTYYDDNTPATSGPDGLKNKPDRIFLPGIFVQDEWEVSEHHKLLGGLRYDYNSVHGSILTPRFSYKFNTDRQMDVLRLNAGRGYRVVNLFTEDHAALTGARKVEIVGELKPEQSWNANLNYVRKIILSRGFLSLDGTAFYTYFSNQILPDYTTDPNKIIYRNLNGYAVSKGVSLNVDLVLDAGLKILAGATLMDVSKVSAGVRSRQLLTERITGTWTISYDVPNTGLSLDYTGNLSGSMLLPLLSPEDPRPAHSPVWSVQNLQLTYKSAKGFEMYGGVKNLLNFSPAKNLPFLIARAHDPFDKLVSYDASGQVLATPENPYRLTFDPSYVYASQQGIRGFLGMRYVLR